MKTPRKRPGRAWLHHALPHRIAWTGGSPPPADFPQHPAHRALYQSLLDEQIADSGGLDLWACAGTTAEERLAIFANRARYDAWATVRDIHASVADESHPAPLDAR